MENTETTFEWTSQIGQDEFAFKALGEKQNGYFLEWKDNKYLFTQKDLELDPVSALEAQYMIEI